MFDSLARLADGKARRVAIFAAVFFVLAGAVGGGVANRLDPYGADDPATETVKAMDRLEEAGLRVPAVIAVVEDAPVAAPATRRRVEALKGEIDDPYPKIVLRGGIEFTQWFADWCERMEEEILAAVPEKRSS